MSSAARTARSRASPITPAAIGIVPNASGRPLRRGLQRARSSCCQCRTSTWCSRCQPQSARSPTRTRPRFMGCCSQRQPRRLPPLRQIPSISAPTSASPPFCTAGVRISSIILTCTVSCRPVAYRRMASIGLPASPASFFRFACSRACSGACSCRASKPCMLGASCSSLPISPRSRTPTGSAHLAPLRKTEWVVYAKPPFAGPKQVLAYLVRYTHRVAIANSRLLDLDETHVSFRWKDYRESGLHKSKVMRINVGEFMRRFLLHVLPNGFHRIRHYGLFANGHRADKLALCRSLLDLPATPTDRYNDDDNGPTASNDESPPCPCCGGRMKIIEIFQGPLSRPYHARKLDGL